MLIENKNYKIFDTRILDLNFHREVMKKGSQLVLNVKLNSSYIEVSTVSDTEKQRFIAEMKVCLDGDGKLVLNLSTRNIISYKEMIDDVNGVIEKECMLIIYNSIKEKIKDFCLLVGASIIQLPEMDFNEFNNDEE